MCKKKVRFSRPSSMMSWHGKQSFLLWAHGGALAPGPGAVAPAIPLLVVLQSTFHFINFISTLSTSKRQSTCHRLASTLWSLTLIIVTVDLSKWNLRQSPQKRTRQLTPPFPLVQNTLSSQCLSPLNENEGIFRYFVLISFNMNTLNDYDSVL